MENSGVQPGQTIAPGSGPSGGSEPKTPVQVAEPPLPPARPPSALPQPSLQSNMSSQSASPPSAAQPAEQQPAAVPTGLERPEQAGEAEAGEANMTGEISWTASEFISHEKNAGWYLGLGMAAIAIAGIIYLITKDFVSVGVVVFGAFMLGIYGSRQPRQLEYRLNPGGVSIGQKYYPFSDFRTFSVIPEGAFSSIVFMPLKRFAPPTTIYYDPKDEEVIVDILSDSLPFEESTHDAVDRLMRRIRF